MMRVIAGVSYSYRNQLRRLTIMLHVSNYPCFSTYMVDLNYCILNSVLFFNLFSIFRACLNHC